MNNKPLHQYLKEKYGERVLKICIDGNFTCPNRDGSKGVGGCIFCSKSGSGDHLENLSIKEQVLNGLEKKKNRANKFIAYFQNYTNTYGSLEELKEKYEEALISDKIVCLDIATRPDCINDNICKLLSSFKSKVDVWIELGLQTANDNTGKLINRCYDSSDFTKAVKLLNKYNIDVIAHIMIGLPGENHKDIQETIKFINKHNIQGIKIHSTYIVENTLLAKMYKEGKYKPIDLNYYIEEVCYCLNNLNSNIIIHKISGDAPKDLLIAPEWNLHKKWILNGVNKLLNRRNNMEEVLEFLKKCGTFYIATEEGEKPRVRPFGVVNIFEGKLYIQTGKSKNVSKQMQINPNIEICGFVDGKWVRVEGKVKRDDRREAKKSMLDANPMLRSMYSEDDDNTEVLYFENAKATFYSFTDKPRSVEF